MPQLGEIYKNKKWQKFIWAACELCGKERWNLVVRGKPISHFCRQCHSGKRGKGGQSGEFMQRGYKLIKLLPNDFFYPMTNNRGWVRENRLVMAQHLGRCLHSWEIVHHINNTKTDNRIENLRLCLADGHNTITGMQNRIDALQKHIDALLQENSELKQKLAGVHTRIHRLNMVN